MNIKKTVFGIVIFLIGATIMEFLIRKVSPSAPNVAFIVMDSLSKSPIALEKIGKFRASHVAFDSISTKKDAYSFTIGIGGSAGDTTLKGVVLKNDDRWEIRSLTPSE